MAHSRIEFVAAEDVCGDLEFYSRKPISDDDSDLKKALHSFQLDLSYSPQFGDVALYAQVLFQHHDYKAAAPLFERALTIVPADGGGFKSATSARRVMRDQAGMSYGISGDLKMARRIFEAGAAEDPDYPMNYYNLACADAGEKKLSDARTHLQQAFDRKANMNPGRRCRFLRKTTLSSLTRATRSSGRSLNALAEASSRAPSTEWGTRRVSFLRLLARKQSRLGPCWFLARSRFPSRVRFGEASRRHLTLPACRDHQGVAVVRALASLYGPNQLVRRFSFVLVLAFSKTAGPRGIVRHNNVSGPCLEEVHIEPKHYRHSDPGDTHWRRTSERAIPL